MNGLPLARILVEGHTNCSDVSKRSGKYHMNLSTDRADKVVSILIRFGQVNPQMVQPKGFGGVQRIYEERHADPTMRNVRLNQRVEFTLLNAKEMTASVHKKPTGSCKTEIRMENVLPTD